MQNITIEKNCDCPMECNSITYSYNFVSRPFQEEKLCRKKKTEKYFLMKDFYNYKSPPQFVRKLAEIKSDSSTNTSDEIDYCKRNIQYRAEVTFRLATDSVSVTVMTRRLSFFDKLSAFGKNII